MPVNNDLSKDKMTELKAIQINRKAGVEHFHRDGQNCDFNLLQFWQWFASDLSNNALRGKLAEFLVAHALGVSDGVRVEWDAYDIKLPNGLTIEIKSSSYLQSWFQRRHSSISFDIRPTRSWNPETNDYSGELRRQAHLYVFCLLSHREKTTLDPTDLNQWSFYVLQTKKLNENHGMQKTISISSLLALNPEKCSFSELHKTITEQGDMVLFPW